VLLFAGLPFAGLELGGFTCVAIAFFLNTGAYYGEILRAGIESIPRGQIEAARSTGLSGLQSTISEAWETGLKAQALSLRSQEFRNAIAAKDPRGKRDKDS